MIVVYRCDKCGTEFDYDPSEVNNIRAIREIIDSELVLCSDCAENVRLCVACCLFKEGKK